ncbi:MAG: TniQ family protein [Blastocatellia bacterium]
MTSSSSSAQSSPAARFLVIPHLAPDETLMGYLLRLAEDNGYAGIKEIEAALHWTIEPTEGRVSSRCCPDLSGLAQATGYDEARFQRICYQDDGQWVTLGVARIPVRYIKFKYPKFCPACLAESPHHRWYWDLAHVTVCLKHQLLLMDRCPMCRKRLYWDRTSLTICACGCDWTQMERQTVTEANELLVSQQVMAFCGWGQQQKDGSFLTNLNFEAFLDTTFFAASLYLLAQKKWTLALKKQNHVFHAGLTEACTVLANPPQSFFAFLDKLYLDEKKRILPMCKDYLGHSAEPLSAWVSEYVEGFPNRRQLRIAF